MNNVECDIVAALLKIVHKNGLIPDATYRGAANRLICTFDKEKFISYDDEKQYRGVHSYGYSESTG